MTRYNYGSSKEVINLGLQLFCKLRISEGSDFLIPRQYDLGLAISEAMEKENISRDITKHINFDPIFGSSEDVGYMLGAAEQYLILRPFGNKYRFILGEEEAQQVLEGIIRKDIFDDTEVNQFVEAVKKHL